MGALHPDCVPSCVRHGELEGRHLPDCEMLGGEAVVSLGRCAKGEAPGSAAAALGLHAAACAGATPPPPPPAPPPVALAGLATALSCSCSCWGAGLAWWATHAVPARKAQTAST
eukprot:1032626-Pelagomonas_calceolata.AAC.1